MPANPTYNGKVTRTTPHMPKTKQTKKRRKLSS